MKHYRWRPEGATEVTREGISAVVYLSDKGRPVAVGYRGRAAKPSFNYSFRDEARRAEYVEQFFANVKARQETVAARREARKAFQTKPQKGDILYGSWGYDQTNVDFFEVVEVVGTQTVKIRELAQKTTETGWLTGNAVPVPGKYVGEPVLKRVSAGYQGDDVVGSPKYGSLWRYDGRPKRWSSYA